jgi:hypothetical protein
MANSGNVVSSDPGSAYLSGLGAELSAARSVEMAWLDSLERLERGVGNWAEVHTETGDYNVQQYLRSVVRVNAKITEARERVQAAHRAITEQQRANLADYEQR